MNEVYISYSHQDSAFVDRLSADLRQVGYSVWVDRQQLSGGESWVNAISEVISNAKFFLIIISRSSMASQWVRAELGLALSLTFKHQSYRVIPILIEDLDTQNIPPQLAIYQFADFRKDYKAAFNKILQVLPEAIRDSQPLQVIKSKAKGYFFISYAEEDAGFIKHLRDFLREREYGYWDYQESERDYDTQMFLELEKRIEQASAILCILSPNWKYSRWAPKEYLFALEVKIPTFLLMVQDMGPTLITVGAPYIDFIQDRTKGFTKLDQELKRKKLI